MIFAATSDVSGKLRGKAFPASKLKNRLKNGVGWTPTNVQITCFDHIAESPFGALGDLLLIPDENTHASVDFGDGSCPVNLMLGDIVTLDRKPWECCTRAILNGALQRLEKIAGLKLQAAFEHEFHLVDGARPHGDAYTYAGYRANAAFGETVMAALNTAGIQSDTFMREYGPDQYEVTVAPELGTRSADVAAILRELVCASAERYGRRASFTPIQSPDTVGNGVHIHMSFVDANGAPATYDPNGPFGMSDTTGSFIAGVLKYLDSIIAITAPSAISYLRLKPHRWSAAFNNLGFHDREASVRICPTSASDSDTAARQYNFEYRAADAAASPHLALAAIIHAGIQGIEDGFPAPTPTEEDLSVLDEDTLKRRGFEKLPQSLANALDRFSANETVHSWFPAGFADVYRDHKLGELKFLEDMSETAHCAAYGEAY